MAVEGRRGSRSPPEGGGGGEDMLSNQVSGSTSPGGAQTLPPLPRALCGEAPLTSPVWPLPLPTCPNSSSRRPLGLGDWQRLPLHGPGSLSLCTVDTSTFQLQDRATLPLGLERAAQASLTQVSAPTPLGPGNSSASLDSLLWCQSVGSLGLVPEGPPSALPGTSSP